MLLRSKETRLWLLLCLVVPPFESIVGGGCEVADADAGGEEGDEPTQPTGVVVATNSPQVRDPTFVTPLPFQPPPYALFALRPLQIRLMDLRTFSAELLWGHSAVVLGVAVSGDGCWMASASKVCAEIGWGEGVGFIYIF